MAEELSKQDGALLLELARKNILLKFGDDTDNFSDLKTQMSAWVLEENRGTFVSLHKQKGLRGCIGNIEPNKTIFEGVKDNARHAAFNDSRFSPLSLDELDDVTIEVSILSRAQKLDYEDTRDLFSKLKPCIDGVMIKKQYNSATFLPQVWNQLKDPETFLTHLCMKAGLSSGEWESGSLDILTYQVQLFEEN